jgi:hypothetical protein
MMSNAVLNPLTWYCKRTFKTTRKGSLCLFAMADSCTLENQCPYPQLCPGPDVLNASSKHYYYVDYPAARLVFISSWSSTLSLTFVSMLMTLFGYLIASQMLRTSSAEQSTGLPSPYQTSVLMRVLNADLFALWDLGSKKVKTIFWAKQQSSDSDDARSPPVLRTSILVFLCCLFVRYAMNQISFHQ